MRRVWATLLPLLLIGEAFSQEVVSLSQGVNLEIQTEKGGRDYCRSRLLALHVPENESPSIFTSPGPFTAVWTGNIQVDLRDRYRFAFEGRGTFQLWIGDRLRLEADSNDPESLVGRRVALNKGPNPFRALYRSPAEGDAECRLLWESTEFPFEPVPASAFLSAETDERWIASAKIRRGRELIAEFRCLSCHLPDTDPTRSSDENRHTRESGNPEGLGTPPGSEDSPSLETIAKRTHPEWVPQWLEDPRRFHPNSPMPRLLHGSAADRDAQDIAAYLASIGADPLPSVEGDVEEGRTLYETVGCVGCHTLENSEADGDPHQRLPLDRLPNKWRTSGELSAFLLNPQSHFDSIRMPNFRLAEAEAANVAAFLLDRAAETASPISGDPERGKGLLTSLGCVNCHGGGGLHPAAFPSLAEVAGQPESGCLDPSESPDRIAPLFPFTTEEFESIRNFLDSGRADSLAHNDPIESLEANLTKLRCNACHERDGHRDVWSLLDPPPAEAAFEDFEGDLNEPEIDQSRPSLTHIGEKLRPDWLEERLRGETGESLRPWLAARMPAFPFHAKVLAEGFARSHGLSPLAEVVPPSDSALAEIGELLVSRKEGFACTACHPIGGRDAHAAYESVGTDFQFAAERLRPDYALRWMFNPLRLDPKTKMPRYTSEEGKTPLVTLLDGDAPRQFEAIWHYLLRGRGISPPTADLASRTERP